MKDKNINLLSTAPLDETLVNKALKHNITIDIISFIKTENTINSNTAAEITELASEQITAVFTSVNGAAAVIEVLQKNALQPIWNIYCIEGKTQSFIKENFISVNIAGTGKNAAALSKIIIHDDVKKIVFFCGNQRRKELPEQLQISKIEVTEIAVYNMNEILSKIDKSYNGVLFFSPSAVTGFFSVNSISADMVLFSIGNTTADAIKKICSNPVIIADFPSREKLTDIAIKYFNHER